MIFSVLFWFVFIFKFEELILLVVVLVYGEAVFGEGLGLEVVLESLLDFCRRFLVVESVGFGI